MSMAAYGPVSIVILRRMRRHSRAFHNVAPHTRCASGATERSVACKLVSPITLTYDLERGAGAVTAYCGIDFERPSTPQASPAR